MTLDKRSAGQSLVEIVIALALGAIIIGGASAAVIVVLQSGTTTQTQQTATVLSQDFAEIGRAFTEGDWHNITGLTHGSSTTYYFLATSSVIIALEGKEGITEGDIRTGLVGHWKLDEATSTAAYDYSDGENTGVLTNAPERLTTGCKGGICLNFNGTDKYVTIGSTSTLEATGDMTLAVWMYPTNCAAGRQGIVSKAYNNEFDLLLESNCAVSFFQGDGTWEEIAEPEGLSAPENVWTHITVVRTASDDTLSFYQNGMLLGTDAYVGDPTASANPIIIGKRDGTTYYFNGRVDDVRVYDRALSADEVNHLYDSIFFTRYFYVENVCRTNDSDYAIAGVSPCDGGEVNDPSTQKMTSVMEWEARSGGQSFVLPVYLTRWQNKAFQQSDWSGGAGETGTVTDKTNKFTSSTDIDAGSVGSFRIEGL